MPAETVPRRLTFCLSSELPVGIPEKRVDDHARLKRPRVVGRRVATWAHAFVFPTPTFQRPSDSTKSKLVLGTVWQSTVEMKARVRLPEGVVWQSKLLFITSSRRNS